MLYIELSVEGLLLTAILATEHYEKQP